MGHLLKKFMEEMTQGQRKESTAQRGMVSDILKAFEKQGGEGAADQVKKEIHSFVIISIFYSIVNDNHQEISPFSACLLNVVV